MEMKTETFYHKNVIVHVHYIEKPNKEKLEEICKEYIARVERSKRKNEKIRT